MLFYVNSAAFLRRDVASVSMGLCPDFLVVDPFAQTTVDLTEEERGMFKHSAFKGLCKGVVKKGHWEVVS